MRPSILYPLFAPIEVLKGIGDKYAKLVKNLCGEKVIDVLFHLPVSVVDRTWMPPLVSAQNGRIWTGIVTITEHQPPQTRKHPYRIYCTDGTAELVLVFFKVYADSLVKNYPVGGQRAISGKLEYFNGLWQMSHPDYSVPAAMLPQIARQEPVYPLTAGVTNKMVCRLEEEALQKVPELPEWQLPESLGDLEYISFNEALQRVHHPGVLRTYCRRRPPAAGWRMMRYCLTSWLWLLFAKKYGSKRAKLYGYRHTISKSAVSIAVCADRGSGRGACRNCGRSECAV